MVQNQCPVRMMIADTTTFLFQPALMFGLVVSVAACLTSTRDSDDLLARSLAFGATGQ
jgi:hypothetical protein